MSASPTVLTHRVIVLDEANNQNRHVEVKMEDGYSSGLTSPIDNVEIPASYNYNNTGFSRNSNNNPSTERFIRVRGEDGVTKYIRATPLSLVNSNQPTQKPQRSGSSSTIRLVPVRTNYAAKSYGSDLLRSKTSSDMDSQPLSYIEQRIKPEPFSSSSGLTTTRPSEFGLNPSSISSNSLSKNSYTYLTRNYNGARSIRPSGWNLTSNNFSRPGASLLRGTAQSLSVSSSLSSYRYQASSLSRNSGNNRYVFPRGPRSSTSYSYLNSSYGTRTNGRRMSYLNFDDSEDRAISEAIAREEELMRMEEDMRRNGSKIDIDLDYQRIEEEILRREAVARQELEQKRLSSLTNYPSPFCSSRRNQSDLDRMTQTKIKEYLTKPTNLEPKITDTEDEKDCRLLLNSMVQTVCQWDKQYGWHKTILRKQRDKRVTFQMETAPPPQNNFGFRKVVRSNESLLNEHVEKLKREIVKKRLALLKEAETELEIEFPPPPKQRRKRAPKNDENSKQSGDHFEEVFTLKEEVIENILATSMDDTKNGNPLDLFADLITQFQPFDDTMLVDMPQQMETAKTHVLDSKEGLTLPYAQPQTPMKNPIEKIEPKTPQESPKRAKTKEAKKKAEEKAQNEETQKGKTKRMKKNKEIFEECHVPVKRGRPSKAKSVESSESSLSPKSTDLDHNKQHCFCNKPYDPKKFYLTCDECKNAFHGKCIGITKKKAKEMESWVCSECAKKESAAKEKLYCMCKQPYDESRFYVGCDKCEDWYHPECVGTTQKIVETAAEYVCPPCRVKQRLSEDYRPRLPSRNQFTDEFRPSSKTQQRPPSALSVIDPLSMIPNRPLNREDYILLWRMWEMLQLHPQSWPFRDRVEVDKLPNYTKVIQKRMDLPSLRVKLEKREYKMAKDFASDVCLMLENARAYHRKYNKDPQILKCADDLENYFYENLSNIKDEMHEKAARRVSECLTHESSLDIDLEQLIGFGSDACLDPSFLQKLL